MLEAIYAAYGLGWDAHDIGAAEAGQLRDEALFLGALVTQLMPDAGEALGLQALMMYCEARHPARFDEAGRFVPLPLQDAARWDREAILGADRLLERAASLGGNCLVS